MPKSIMKVYLDTIGCRLNLSEIESMARQFRVAGHEIVAMAENADLAVVNTCAVTAKAASDSRGKIRHIARSGVDEIIATGCWTTLQPKEAAALPGVLRVVTNDRKELLVADVLNLPQESFDLEPIIRQRLPGIHYRTRAFIKVQDGCDNHCTFCITTVARGQGRSRPLQQIIGDIQAALVAETKEIILTGVHLGSWGQDFGCHLRDLIRAVLRETDVSRLRLSSLEPWDLDADFFSLWDNRRLCQHLHLPLQSGSASTLKRMARKTTPDSFRNLIVAARQIIPDVAITTDMIAGFPGETEAEFSESLDFTREMNFAGGHAFTYSARPGTGAARMSGQVRPSVSKERNAAYRAAFDNSAKDYRQRFIGQSTFVLWESMTQLNDRGWQMEGLADNYIRVTAPAETPRWNIVDEVKLKRSEGDKLSGEIIGSR
jgi:threonylcarbamoyladenosine tRNA methylthiotransferase MtaB